MQFNVQAYQNSLAELKLPIPDPNTILDVLDIEGDFFANAISAIKAGNQRAQSYLKGILYAIAPETKERLKRRGLMVPNLQVLTSIGRREGPQFALKLKLWDESGKDNIEEARFVRLTLARHLEKSTITPAPSPSHNRAASTQSSVPPTTAPADQDGEDACYQNAQEDDDQREYKSHHVYGGKYAACFSIDVTKNKYNTIRIEATESNAQRSYDWSKKVAIQVSQRELPLLLAVFMLWIPKFEGKGHGTNNEKWFTVERQQGKLFLSVQNKGSGARGIAITAGDAYSITTMVIGQMMKNDPALSAETVLAITKKQAELMLTMQNS